LKVFARGQSVHEWERNSWMTGKPEVNFSIADKD